MMTTMTMCRAMCLLAIVLYCVGVANANAEVKRHTLQFVTTAHEMAEKTLEMKEKCVEAGTAAQQAAREADGYAATIDAKIEAVAADPAQLDKTKLEGQELIKKANEAAVKARDVAGRTRDSATATSDKAMLALLQAEQHYESSNDAALKAEYADMKVTAENASQTAEDAERAVADTGSQAEHAEAAAKRVEEAIKKLEAAVVAAAKKKKGELTKAEKEKKQVDSQAQSQTQDPTVAGHQGQTEENKTQQTTEKGKDAQGQHSRRTITVNIRGENLDALFNDAKNKSGMALQDSSSVPALLRVPLLLLLLFSVLGCMTVC